MLFIISRVLKFTVHIKNIIHRILLQWIPRQRANLKKLFLLLLCEKYQLLQYECVYIIVYIRKFQWTLVNVLFFSYVMLVSFFRCVIFLFIYSIILALEVEILHASLPLVLTLVLLHDLFSSRC